MRRMWHAVGLLVLLALLAGNTAVAAQGVPLTLLGVKFQQDEPFPEYQCLWHDRDFPTSCGTAIVGANVHVYLRNDGASAVTVSDVTLAGYSLNKILRAKVVGDHLPLRSIYHYWDNPPRDILDAGEPVWYKADPATIPPGMVAQVVVRLRSVPVTRPVSLGIVTSAGTIPVAVPVATDSPQLASVGFSPDLTTVYLHWRRAGGAGPATVLMDGEDVTAKTTTVDDPALNFGATALQLEQPLAPVSYHVFQGVWPDGSTASASLRAWVNPFVYGTWGAKLLADSDLAGARAWIDDATNRGVNSLIMNVSSGGLSNLLRTAAGRQYAADRGYGFVTDEPSAHPRLWFIDDEPDAEEANVPCGPSFRIPCGGGHTVGILAMSMVQRGEDLRRHDPLAPTMINMDNGWKPSNWYTYGQLADVLGADSYYQRRLFDTYYLNPQHVPLYRKATVIYATSLALTTAAEPNPTQFLLYSNQQTIQGKYWPFPTPQSKRIEAYYALAGGAKGMAYWWYKPPSGLGAGGPGSAALWKEIGLLGNEIKTASPLLVTSHPVDLPVQGSEGVWVKPLAVGIDTLILIAVNDQYYNDPAGFHSTPVADATVTATLPAWIQSPTAFEIDASGLSDVSALLSGNQIQLNLGTLDLTRMIVLTTNPQLRASMQQRYDQLVAPGVCAFAPDVCPTTPSAPVITQHPVGIAVKTGDTAPLTVAATGGNLSYRWQKDGEDLGDGGSISGATSASLQITGVQAGHAGAYRAIVSNSYGSASSNAATLTVVTPTATSTGVPTTPPAASPTPTLTAPPPPTATMQPTVAPSATSAPSSSLQNGTFDASTSGWQVAPSWTSYSSGTATFSKETTVVRSAPNAQKIQPPGSGAGAYAGVRQTIAADVGDAVTFVAWAYQDSPNTYETARLGARFDGVTSPPSSWVNVSSRQAWTELAASGTVTVANGATVFLDVARGGSGTYWSAFDNVVAYRAYLPPAPVVSGPGATTLIVDVQPGGNSPNGVAEYAITIGGGAYVQGTSWVQADGSVGTTAVWQTDAAWGTKSVTGLATGTTYTFSVKARFSSVYPRETSLGAGAQAATSSSPTATRTSLPPSPTPTTPPTMPPTPTRTAPPPPTATTPPTAPPTAPPSTILQNGNFDASTSGWQVAPNWTSYSSATAAFDKETTVVRSAPNAQKIQPPGSGSGAYAGVRQTIAANVGDAVTFVAWAYQDSPNTYETARLGARFDGVTSPPSSWVNVSSRQVWTELKASGTVTVANGATVFLDVLRGGSGTYWSVFDNVSAYQASVPSAPAVSGASASSLNVDVQPDGNSGNGAAEFAITIGGGAYTQGASWVQANGSVGTAAVWQTDAAWGTKTVTGLAAGTTYSFSVKARHSSANPRETLPGAAAQGVPVSVPGPTPTFTPQPPTVELHRYWVKPDWLSPYWGYRPRDVAPAPAVNRSGVIDDRTSFRRARLTEQWQWFWADLLSLSKYKRVFAELTVDEKADITRAFGGLTGDHLAFTNNAGSASKNCYPCGTTDRGEDMRIDPLICGGNTILGSAPVQNKHGQWMVKVYSFDANQPPPAATLEMLNDPRVLWATIISDVRLPDVSYKLFGFPQLKDGIPVPYPYMTMEDYYYPLEELEEYPLTDPKRRIYNP